MGCVYSWWAAHFDRSDAKRTASTRPMFETEVCAIEISCGLAGRNATERDIFPLHSFHQRFGRFDIQLVQADIAACQRGHNVTVLTYFFRANNEKQALYNALTFTIKHTGFERKSAHIWYERLRRASPTLSHTVSFAPEASPSTVSM